MPLSNSTRRERCPSPLSNLSIHDTKSLLSPRLHAHYCQLHYTATGLPTYGAQVGIINVKQRSSPISEFLKMFNYGENLLESFIFKWNAAVLLIFKLEKQVYRLFKRSSIHSKISNFQINYFIWKFYSLK